MTTQAESQQPASMPYPLKPGDFVAVYMTEDLAKLLNRLNELDRNCGGTGHAPEIYLITAAQISIPGRIKRLQDVMEMNVATAIRKGGGN